MIDNELLLKFTRESNRIEGINDEPTPDEYDAYANLLSLDKIDIDDLVFFTREIAGADLRSEPGMNVIVGNHMPPGGGQQIITALKNLLVGINTGVKSSYAAHHEYETLHPFMDGNGRSGRALWLWMLQKKYGYASLTPTLERGFLHTWYYQSLQDRR